MPGVSEDARIERRFRDADLRVGRGHRALRGGDVGAPLQQVGRHAERNRRRLRCSSDLRRSIENCGAGTPTSAAIACSNCARVVEQQLRLHARRVEFSDCLLQGRRGPDTEPRSCSVVHVVERLLLQFHRAGSARRSRRRVRAARNSRWRPSVVSTSRAFARSSRDCSAEAFAPSTSRRIRPNRSVS
jgi:hypothetical protein